MLPTGHTHAPTAVIRQLATSFADKNASEDGCAMRGDGEGGGTATCGRPAGLWLLALSDPVAGVHAYTPCVHTCNLYGDGDWKLVLADAEDRKLKVEVFHVHMSFGCAPAHGTASPTVPLQRIAFVCV
jgi:hypothetical protein